MNAPFLKSALIFPGLLLAKLLKNFISASCIRKFCRQQLFSLYLSETKAPYLVFGIFFFLSSVRRWPGR